MRESTFKSKYITGKRLNILISKDAYKALEKQKKQINTTRYIEHLLIKADENPESIAQSFDEQNKYLDQITQLINFNKKLYLDINATFSNLNQIAYRQNITLYIKIAQTDIDTLKSLIRVLLESIAKNLMTKESKKLDERIYLVLDEFIRFGKMPFLLEMPALCRSYGIVPLYIT